MATIMGNSVVVETTLALKLSGREVEIIKDWVRNPLNGNEMPVESKLRELIFNALSNPGAVNV